MSSHRAGILSEISAERSRQDTKWGEQNHPDGTGRPGDSAFAEAYKAICKANGPGEDTYRDILAEEVYEAFAETDPVKLRAELVQVAAVCVQWIEALDRRAIRWPLCENCGLRFPPQDLIAHALTHLGDEKAEVAS